MRMETMVSTNDGFVIAERDLEIRGPGYLMWSQQSGEIPLKITNLIKDNELISKVRLLVSDILKKDPNLRRKENYIISKNLKNIFDKKEIWEYIS
jgi:ATP-dependent DNA helicase RecG